MTRAATQRALVLLATAVGCYAGAPAAPESASLEPRPTADGDAAAAGADGMASAIAVVTGVPCDVAGVLAGRCTVCHGRPPTSGAPMPMVTYDDLVAPSPSDHARAVVDVAVDRMRDPIRPMPPSGAAASDAAVLAAWRSAGLPRGSCSAPAQDGGGGYGTETICTSHTYWSGGSEGSASMHPGAPCLGCHRGEEGPVFTASGTVFPTAHEPDECNGASGVSAVVITDAKNRTVSLAVNEAGNFFTGAAITMPYRAKVVVGERENVMSSPQSSGDCNACHTEVGASGAPGRVVAP